MDYLEYERINKIYNGKQTKILKTKLPMSDRTSQFPCIIRLRQDVSQIGVMNKRLRPLMCQKTWICWGIYLDKYPCGQNLYSVIIDDGDGTKYVGMYYSLYQIIGYPIGEKNKPND